MTSQLEVCIYRYSIYDINKRQGEEGLMTRLTRLSVASWVKRLGRQSKAVGFIQYITRTSYSQYRSVGLKTIFISHTKRQRRGVATTTPYRLRLLKPLAQTQIKRTNRSQSRQNHVTMAAYLIVECIISGMQPSSSMTQFEVHEHTAFWWYVSTTQTSSSCSQPRDF